MKIMIGLLAAASSLAVASPAHAAALISGSGTWNASTAKTALSAASSTFSFSFEVPNPLNANPTNKISNFSYYLNGAKVAATATAVTFYDVSSYGLFDISTSAGTVAIYGVDIENLKNLKLGTYSFAAAGPNGAYPGTGSGSLTVTNAAVPEPATWAMMIMGFGVVGGALRRRKVSTAVRFA